MAKSTKLSKDQIEKLSKIGIKGCKTVEESREQMVAKMVELGIEDDGESWDDVYDIVSTLLDDPEAENDELADEVEDEESEDEEEDESEEEDEEEDESEEEDEEEDEEEEISIDDMKAVLIESGMTKKALSKLSDKKIQEQFELLTEEEEEEEEEVVEKPKSKKETKPEADTKKKSVNDKKAKEDNKKSEVKKSSKRLNPKEIKEDAALYDALKKALAPFGKFEYNFIANGGVSIKFLGKNATKVFFSFDSPKLIDKSVVGRVYSSAIKTDEKLAELFGEDFEIKKDWSGIPIMVDISLEEIIEALKENKKFFETLLKSLEGKDAKLGKNREKMEEQLKDEQKDKAQVIKDKLKNKSADKKVEEPVTQKKKTTKKPEVEEPVEEVKKTVKKTTDKKKNKK